MKKVAAIFVVSLIGLATPASAETYIMKFGTLAPDNTPWSRILKNFKRRVEKQSGGRIKVRLYLNGQRGDEKEMLSEIRNGRLQGGGFSTGGISSVVPELQVLEIPFMFPRTKDADCVMDKVVWDDLSKLLTAKGLYLYVWAENGWIDFAHKEKFLRSPDDFKDEPMYAYESDVAKAVIEALGASPKPLDTTQVLTSLQTGLVKGFATTPIFGSAAQWTTQVKYWTDSDHVYQPAAVVFDQKFWDKLPEDLKEIVLKGKEDLQKRARRDVRGIDKKLFKEFTENGIQIVRLTSDERKAFRTALKGVGPKLVSSGVIPEALYNKVRQGVKDCRAGKL
ncbi:MAG: TRAP transporter substrate-binding protein DctP [Deltaproteobacteria bacterium]|nr:TRAP transporter substrate-binding protein DctP [Deltaproteobacteria bacterium]